MPIGTLITTVMSVLLPYVSKGAEEFAKEVGKSAFEKASRLMSAIRTKFSGNSDTAQAVQMFENNPELYRPALEVLLEKTANQDPAFQSQLVELIEAMGPELVVVQKMKAGKNVTGIEIDEMAGGSARVDQDIEQAEGVTGAKVKKLGAGHS